MFQGRMLRRNVEVDYSVFDAVIPSNNRTQGDLQSVFAKVNVLYEVMRHILLKKIQNTSK